MAGNVSQQQMTTTNNNKQQHQPPFNVALYALIDT